MTSSSLSRPITNRTLPNVHFLSTTITSVNKITLSTIILICLPKTFMTSIMNTRPCNVCSGKETTAMCITLQQKNGSGLSWCQTKEVFLRTVSWHMFRLCVESLIYWIKFLNETTVVFPLTSSWSVNCSHLGFKVMAHSHCTETGTGTGKWWVSILCCTVHTTQGQRQVHGTIVFYCAHPVSCPCPCPCPCPVQCVWAIKIPLIYWMIHPFSWPI